MISLWHGTRIAISMFESVNHLKTILFKQSHGFAYDILFRNNEKNCITDGVQLVCWLIYLRECRHRSALSSLKIMIWKFLK